MNKNIFKVRFNLRSVIRRKFHLKKTQ